MKDTKIFVIGLFATIAFVIACTLPGFSTVGDQDSFIAPRETVASLVQRFEGYSDIYIEDSDPAHWTITEEWEGPATITFYKSDKKLVESSEDLVSKAVVGFVYFDSPSLNARLNHYSFGFTEYVAAKLIGSGKSKGFEYVDERSPGIQLLLYGPNQINYWRKDYWKHQQVAPIDPTIDTFLKASGAPPTLVLNRYGQTGYVAFDEQNKIVIELNWSPG